MGGGKSKSPLPPLAQRSDRPVPGNSTNKAALPSSVAGRAPQGQTAKKNNGSRNPQPTPRRRRWQGAPPQDPAATPARRRCPSRPTHPPGCSNPHPITARRVAEPPFPPHPARDEKKPRLPAGPSQGQTGLSPETMARAAKRRSSPEGESPQLYTLTGSTKYKYASPCMGAITHGLTLVFMQRVQHSSSTFLTTSEM